MAKILFITSGFSGIVNSSFEVIKRLEKEGHEVVYATLLDAREQVEFQGFTYLSLPDWHKNLIPRVSPQGNIFNQLSNFVSSYLNANNRQLAGIERLGQSTYLKILNKTSPDLVMIDIECHEYIFTTYVAGLPLLLISQWFNGKRASGLPPISSSLMVAQEEKVKTIWQERRKKLRRNFWKQKLLSAGTDRRSLLLNYARRINFPIHLLDFYSWPPPFTYRQLPIMHFTDEALELPHEIPANHYYLGPMVCENRKVNHKDLPDIREQLARIYALKQRINAKLIYCSVSTMSGGSGDFIRTVVEACEKEAGWILLIAQGGHPDQFLQGKSAENIYVFPWLPQLEVLALTDCSLNHAGINTINECIMKEVPMVVYSGGQHDQNGCAVRVAHHKLGVMGNRLNATPRGVHRDISMVLNNPTYKSNVTAARRRNLSQPVRDRLVDLVNSAMLKPDKLPTVDD